MFSLQFDPDARSTGVELKSAAQLSTVIGLINKSNRKAMNRNWSNQKSSPALKTKAGNK